MGMSSKWCHVCPPILPSVPAPITIWVAGSNRLSTSDMQPHEFSSQPHVDALMATYKFDGASPVVSAPVPQGQNAGPAPDNESQTTADPALQTPAQQPQPPA